MTPVIDAVVEVARNMTGKDFVEEARTLGRLGLSDMDGPQIRSVVDEGFPVSVLGCCRSVRKRNVSTEASSSPGLAIRLRMAVVCSRTGPGVTV